MSEEKKSYEDEGYFKFPFKPYSIQEDFMKKLYYTLENDKIGIFESPTGTGKSLSLICGALTWLRDYETRKEEEIKKILAGGGTCDKNATEPEENKEVDWVEEFYQEKAAKDMLAKVKEKEESKNKKRDRLHSLRKESKLKKRKREDLPSVDSPLENEVQGEDSEKKKNEEEEEDEDKDLVLVDYTSDNESTTKCRGSDESSGEDEKAVEEDEGLKIFYCSRTHSQLTQFVHEVQKSPFADWIKVVALASRQSYCINEDVKHLKSVNKINEKCLDMQKKKKEKKEKKSEVTEKPTKKRRKKNEVSGCPYYSYARFQDFQDHVTVDVQDIEQLVSLGKDLDTCPYYGSRHSIPKAQLVVLPYQTLLHKSTRASVGVKLKGNVVIIDEAHNLIETINSIHSNEVSLAQILLSISQLTQYRDKYKNRLKAKNLMYITQILYVLNALKDVLKAPKVEDDKENAHKKEKVESLMLTINDFLSDTKLDNINLFKICKYCEKSLIAQKLNGFVDKYQGVISNQNRPQPGNEGPPTTSQFLYIESFLDALTNCDKDGRILITKTGMKVTALASKSSIKFLLLNPAVHFIDVVKECKAVVVAGGTMQPISEFKDVLLYSAQVTADRITEFSCGHVIPPENLTAVCIGKGPTQIDLNFAYQNRDNPQLIDELSRVLCNICTIVPGGVVCFFPSYDYEEFVYSRWKKIGAIEKIEKRKKIFREPKKTGGCENVLNEYTKAIKSSFGTNGALLLSVVGGKMSEGINFSDQLGRCIVMVGLPYPNKNSPELKEKMEFLNKNIGPNAGQEHYENICMKAVNQSIGRAIRHKGDYATILLLDQRYARNSVQGKLPTWIRSQLQLHQRFGPGFASISRFFAAKRNEATASSS